MLRRIYRAVYDQCPHFQKDVRRSRRYRLDHSIGVDNPRETVLTKDEFLTLLQELAELSAEQK